VERLISKMNEINHLRHFGVELGGPTRADTAEDWAELEAIARKTRA
jgi:hypothetical protein